MKRIVVSKHAHERWKHRSNRPEDNIVSVIKESKKLGKHHRKRFVGNHRHKDGTHYFLSEAHQMAFLLRDTPDCSLVVTCFRVDI